MQKAVWKLFSIKSALFTYRVDRIYKKKFDSKKNVGKKKKIAKKCFNL